MFDFDIDADDEEPSDTFKPSCDNLKSTDSILDVQVSGGKYLLISCKYMNKAYRYNIIWIIEYSILGYVNI